MTLCSKRIKIVQKDSPSLLFKLLLLLLVIPFSTLKTTSILLLRLHE